MVRIGVDNDTLNFLNFDKYTDRTDLYYRQLPDDFTNCLRKHVIFRPAATKGSMILTLNSQDWILWRNGFYQ